MDDVVSVIVPIYNAEKNLSRCVKSVLAQSYRKIEVILINDGSNDGTLNLCQYYASNDSRIRIIDKENGGVSSARNQGIKSAKGKWICFVDADDYILPDYISNFFRYADKKSTDIICSGATEIHCKKNKLLDYKVEGEKRYCGCDIRKLVTPIIDNRNYDYPEINSRLMGYPWGKIYRKSVLYNVYFNEKISIREDALFNIEAFFSARTISIIPGANYCYITGGQSAMSKYYKNYTIEAQNFLDILKKYCKKFQIELNSYYIATLYTYMNWIKLYALHKDSGRNFYSNYKIIKESLNNIIWREAFDKVNSKTLPIHYRILRFFYQKHVPCGIMALYFISKIGA